MHMHPPDRNMYVLAFTHVYYIHACTHTLKHAYTHVHSIQTFTCRKGRVEKRREKEERRKEGKKGED